MTIKVAPIQGSATHCPRCKGPCDETTIQAKRCPDCSAVYHAACLGPDVYHCLKPLTCCSFVCHPVGHEDNNEEEEEEPLTLDAFGETHQITDAESHALGLEVTTTTGETYLLFDYEDLEEAAREQIEEDLETYVGAETLVRWAEACIKGGPAAATQFGTWVSGLMMGDLIPFTGSYDHNWDSPDLSERFLDEHCSWDYVTRID